MTIICEYCEQQFASSFSRTRHIKRKHGGKFDHSDSKQTGELTGNASTSENDSSSIEEADRSSVSEKELVSCEGLNKISDGEDDGMIESYDTKLEDVWLKILELTNIRDIVKIKEINDLWKNNNLTLIIDSLARGLYTLHNMIWTLKHHSDE